MAMKGKWGYLDGQYARMENSEFTPGTERFTRMMTQFDVYKTQTLDELTKALNARKDEKEDIAKREKECNLHIEALERALELAMQAQNLDTVVMNGFRWTPGLEPYPKTTDKAAQQAWQRDHMPDAMTVNANTFQAHVKTCIESKKPLPAGTDVHLKRTFSRTKQ